MKKRNIYQNIRAPKTSIIGALLSSREHFSLGEELRFVPGFPFPYEKRDKSADTYTVCMWCSRKVNIGEDTCPRCHKPVIK